MIKILHCYKIRISMLISFIFLYVKETVLKVPNKVYMI